MLFKCFTETGDFGQAWHVEWEWWYLGMCHFFILADMSGSQWNEVALNGEDLSYMLDDETTPVKACGDLAYHATHNGRGLFC